MMILQEKISLYQLYIIFQLFVYVLVHFISEVELCF